MRLWEKPHKHHKCSNSENINKKSCKGRKGHWVASIREMFSTSCALTQIQMEIKLLLLQEALVWQHFRGSEKHKVNKKDKWCNLFTSVNKEKDP